MFRSMEELKLHILEPLNKLHCSHSGNRHLYFIHFTDKYAQLKCSGRTHSGKECLFRYWFKFKRNAASGENFDFELYRLINSNHSLPLH